MSKFTKISSSAARAPVCLRIMVVSGVGGYLWDGEGKNFTVYFIKFNELAFVFLTTGWYSFCKNNFKIYLFEKNMK